MKKILSIIMIFIISTLFTLNVFAASSNQLFNLGAVMINQETGKITPVEVTYTISPKVQINSTSSEEHNEITAEATFKIPNPPGITPLYTDTASSTSDVTASLSINYDRREDEIRVNRVYGSWTPLVSQITISNREVHYGDGGPFGNNAHKYPTSNSFSYTTGWGWVLWYPAVTDAGSGARAFSEATVSVSGMGTPHQISVFVTANQ